MTLIKVRRRQWATGLILIALSLVLFWVLTTGQVQEARSTCVGQSIHERRLECVAETANSVGISPWLLAPATLASIGIVLVGTSYKRVMPLAIAAKLLDLPPSTVRTTAERCDALHTSDNRLFVVRNALAEISSQAAAT